MNKHLLRNGLLFSTLIAMPTEVPCACRYIHINIASRQGLPRKPIYTREWPLDVVWRDGIPINEKAGFAPAFCQISLWVSSAYRAPSPADRDGHSKKSGAEQH